MIGHDRQTCVEALQTIDKILFQVDKERQEELKKDYAGNLRILKAFNLPFDYDLFANHFDNYFLEEVGINYGMKK